MLLYARPHHGYIYVLIRGVLKIASDPAREYMADILFTDRRKYIYGRKLRAETARDQSWALAVFLWVFFRR